MKKTRCMKTELAGLWCAIALGVVPFAAPGTARAGFDWTPPPAAIMSEPAVPSAVALPSAPVEAEDLSAQEPLTPDMLPVDMPVQEDAAPVVQNFSSPVLPSLPYAATSYMPAPPTPGERPVYDDVAGFGRDLPLVLVLRQVVPPSYSFSFDPGINQGVRISWNGGKPWNEVLEDALRPLELRVAISGDNVRVRRTWDEAVDNTVMTPVQPMPVQPMKEPAVAQEPATPFMAPPNIAAQPEVIMQSYPRHVPNPPPAAPMGVDNRYSALPVPLVPQAMPSPPSPAAVMMKSQQPAAMGVSSTARGPVMDPLEIVFWQAEAGSSLRDVLNRWSNTANVAILWNSPYDYMLPAPVQMHGTFPDAVTQILTSFNAIDPRPLGQLHPNLPTGPSVLVIENYSSATN